MVIKDYTDNEKLSLQEFLDICDSFGEVQNKVDYEKFYLPLIRLANNENLLIDFLNDGLQQPENFQLGTSYSMQSLALAEREYYDVRMNFWPTDNEFNISDSSIAGFFAYNFAHDHNFDLITTGYSKNGYITDIYNYIYGSYFIGEHVDITFDGRYELKKGRVMFYESSKDIHIQIPPKEFAISINILPKRRNKSLQYSFDIENKTIKSVIKEGSLEFNLKAIIDSVGDPDLIKLFKQTYK